MADAQFVVKKGDKYLKQDNDGAWSLVDTQEAATTFTSANKTGLVQIKGLAAGDYTVMETAAPNG